MANVAVDENSLKAIGDALREKLGSKRTLTEKEYKPYDAVRYVYSDYAYWHGNYATNKSSKIENKTFKWEGAKYLFIKVSYKLAGTSGTFRITNSRNSDVVYQKITSSYPGHEKIGETTLTVQGDTFNVVATDAENFSGHYFIEVTAADGNFLYLQDSWEYDVPVGEEENTFYPAEMADAIRRVQNNAEWKMATVADTSDDATIREFDFSSFGIDFEKDNFWVLEFDGYFYRYGSSWGGAASSAMDVSTVRISPMTFFGGSAKGKFYYAPYGGEAALDTKDNPYCWYKPSYDGKEERTGFVELFNNKLRIHSRGINPKSGEGSGWLEFLDYNETVTLYYLGNKEA